MAKVIGPLFSLEASGTFADTLTFDKRGIVRNKVNPTNPKTASQGNVRLRFAGAQAGIKRITNITTIQTVRDQSPTSYYWNAYLMKYVIGNAASSWINALAAFNVFSAPDQALWDTDANTLGIVVPTITYASDPPLTSGQIMFALATALNRDYGIGTPPIATNSSAWVTVLS